MRILVVAPHMVGFAPGQRVRVESWADDLRDRGHDVEIAAMESEALNEVLHSPGQATHKVRLLIRDWTRQAKALVRAKDFDGVILHREASLVGPAILERIPALRGVPTIYDIDDPVFVPYRSPHNGRASTLKFHAKTDSLLRRSTAVTAINNRIGEYASEHNDSVTIIPNFVDASGYQTRSHQDLDGRMRILWIGSKTTLPNLESLAPVIAEVDQTHPLQLVVVGPAGATTSIENTEYHEWSPETERLVGATCDVGIVPVPKSPWADWKFYFKLIQYMAAGLPVIADDRGSNRAILERHCSGIAVKSHGDWARALTVLHESTELRARMGASARKAVDVHFDARHRGPLIEKVALQSFSDR